MIRNKVIRENLELIQRRLDLMDRTLVVNNPDSPRAAEVFEGLRRSVIRSTDATRTHEAALAQLDAIARATSDVEMIRAKIRELMSTANVTITDDFNSFPQAFDRMGSGEKARTTRPAYLGAGGSEVVRGVVEMFDDRPLSSETAANPVDDQDATPGVTDSESETGNPQEGGS